MQTSVNLEPPFSYTMGYVIIVLLIILAITIWWYLNKNKKQLPLNIEVREENKKNIKAIKIKYLKKLLALENKLDKNEIQIRKAYQNLSSIIRYFVHAVTGIKVQNCTLEDIKELNMPKLYDLIKEYYRPEFAEKSLGDIKASIEKTRKVIKKWN